MLTVDFSPQTEYLYRLLHTFGYPAERLHVEFSINFGREIKRADIAIMDRDRPTVPYVIVEVKKPKLKDGKEQSNPIPMRPAHRLPSRPTDSRFLTITEKTRITF